VSGQTSRSLRSLQGPGLRWVTMRWVTNSGRAVVGQPWAAVRGAGVAVDGLKNVFGVGGRLAAGSGLGALGLHRAAAPCQVEVFDVELEAVLLRERRFRTASAPTSSPAAQCTAPPAHRAVSLQLWSNPGERMPPAWD